MDKHVIYQDFSFYIPYDSTVYSKLNAQVPSLKALGVTDVWLAPPYRALNSYFEESYAFADRYHLGEFPAGHGGALATKYGTAAELRTTINTLHTQGMNAIADLVPNQLFLDMQEVTRVTATDIFGNPNNMESQVLHATEHGTPQGGIISPVLANLALDGLDRRIRGDTRCAGKDRTGAARQAFI